MHRHVGRASEVMFGAGVLRIGTLPSCQWFMEGQVLQVLLGEEPSIALGDVVSTLPSALAALWLKRQERGVVHATDDRIFRIL